jgi:hypothetical protein
MSSTPIVINGQVYPSRKAAADALGINYDTFQSRLRCHRTLDAPLGVSGRARDDFAKQIAVLAVKGWTLPQIAHELGEKQETVRSMAYRRGIAIRPVPGGWRTFRREPGPCWANWLLDRDFDD